MNVNLKNLKEINTILIECNNRLYWNWGIDLKLDFALINLQINRFKLAEAWRTVPLMKETAWGYSIKEQCDEIAIDLTNENYGKIIEHLKGL